MKSHDGVENVLLVIFLPRLQQVKQNCLLMSEFFKRHKILIILVAFADQNLTIAGHIISLFSDENVMNCSIQKVKLKH